MEKQKKSVGTIALVVLLLIVTVAALVLATYAWAKYTTTNTDSASANVAKWNVNANIANESQWSQVYTHVVDQKLAPGTSGVIPVTVNANATEVCTYYQISIESVSGNKPTNLKFYKGVRTGAGTEQSPYVYSSTGTGYSAASIASQELINGYLNYNGTGNTSATDSHNTAGTSATEYIYWEWPYETAGNNDAENAANDRQDTNDGINAVTNATMTVSIKVVATQVNPANGTI